MWRKTQNIKVKLEKGRMVQEIKKKKKAVNDQNTKENLSLGIQVTFYVQTAIKIYYIKTRTLPLICLQQWFDSYKSVNFIFTFLILSKSKVIKEKLTLVKV